MGELLGIPEWLAMTLFVLVSLVVWLGAGAILWKRAMTKLAIRRPNPTHDEFMEMMKPDVSSEAASFLWDQTLFYLKPDITPHPNDDLVNDFPIDDDDWSMDWPREWAEKQGFHESNFHEWPEGWPVTIRNFGRWLDMGPK